MVPRTFVSGGEVVDEVAYGGDLEALECSLLGFLKAKVFRYIIIGVHGTSILEIVADASAYVCISLAGV